MDFKKDQVKNVDRPSLTLCMIVKNEEEMLPRCLYSVNSYVDELIIVDTGSTDGTINIAKDFGAKIFHYPWEEDFSKHRNQSIKHAQGEWILFLDADEELKRGSGEVLRQAIKEKDIDAIEITNISLFNNGSSEAWINQKRVFRNKPDIFFSDIVHEQLSGIRKCKRFPIYVYHCGYDLKGERSQKKQDRNVALIKRQIANEPNNYFYHLNLAVCYSTHFEFSRAINEGLEALNLAENQGILDENVLWAQYIVSFSYLKLGDLDNAERYALQATRMSTEHLDSYFILSIIYHKKKDWDRFFKVSSKLLDLYNLLKFSPEKMHSRLIHMANEEWRIHLGRGDLYLHRGDMNSANKEFESAKALSAHLGECYQIIGDCYRNRGFWEQAEINYKLCLKQQGDNSEALFGLALLYKRQDKINICREFIGKISESRIKNPEIFFEKGLLCFRDQNFEPAIDFFQKATELDSDFLPAYQNLALAYKYTGRFQEAIEINLKSLKLKPKSTEMMINLGYLYYETKEFDKAKEIFETVLNLDPSLVDIRILMCEIHLMCKEAEKCIYQCEKILKELNLSFDVTLSNLSDLAGIFLLIGQVLVGYQKNEISEKAINLARQFDPRIEEKLKRLGNEISLPAL